MALERQLVQHCVGPLTVAGLRLTGRAPGARCLSHRGVLGALGRAAQHTFLTFRLGAVTRRTEVWSQTMSSSIDHRTFSACVMRLYEVVADLEAMFPGRPFTPDGHMVGSLGECLVADAYGLELMPPSNTGFDARTASGRQVEIKATQAKSVAFRSCPQHTIVIKILPDGSFEEHYNGPGALVWRQFDGKPKPSNGQYSVSLSRLAKLMKEVPEADRI